MSLGVGDMGGELVQSPAVMVSESSSLLSVSQNSETPNNNKRNETGCIQGELTVAGGEGDDHRSSQLSRPPDSRALETCGKSGEAFRSQKRVGR